MKMNQINSVCVYSASSTKIDAVYFQAADTLGRLLAEHRIRLINGAGSIGLMRSVADAVLKNGGEVTGVFLCIGKEVDEYLAHTLPVGAQFVAVVHFGGVVFHISVYCCFIMCASCCGKCIYVV